MPGVVLAAYLTLFKVREKFELNASRTRQQAEQAPAEKSQKELGIAET